jgi:hypothetical protein
MFVYKNTTYNSGYIYTIRNILDYYVLIVRNYKQNKNQTYIEKLCDHFI